MVKFYSDASYQFLFHIDDVQKKNIHALHVVIRNNLFLFV